jgi:hypothetical protein
VQKAVLERERHKLEMFRRVIDVGLVLVTFGAILIVVFTTMGRATRWGWRSGNGTFLDLEPLLDESVSLYLVCFLGATTVGAGILTISTIPTDSADLDVLLGSATRGRLLTGGVFVALAGLKMFEEAPALYPRTGGAWGLNFIHPTAFILWVVYLAWSEGGRAVDSCRRAPCGRTPIRQPNSKISRASSSIISQGRTPRDSTRTIAPARTAGVRKVLTTQDSDGVPSESKRERLEVGWSPATAPRVLSTEQIGSNSALTPYAKTPASSTENKRGRMKVGSSSNTTSSTKSVASPRNARLSDARYRKWLPNLTSMIVGSLFSLLAGKGVWFVCIGHCHSVGTPSNTSTALRNATATSNMSRRLDHEQTPHLPHLVLDPSACAGFEHSVPDAKQAPFWYASGALLLVASLWMVAAYLRQRIGFVCSDGEFGGSSTASFYSALYFSLVSFGLETVCRGIWRLSAFACQDGVPLIFTGLVWLTPPVVLFVLGKDFMFGLLSRRFDRNRGEMDGAVIASILDKTPIHVGMPWWRHHGLNINAARFADPSDHRRNWARGKVVCVKSDVFGVTVGGMADTFGFGSFVTGSRIGSRNRSRKTTARKKKKTASVAPAAAPLNGRNRLAPADTSLSSSSPPSSNVTNKMKVASAEHFPEEKVPQKWEKVKLKGAKSSVLRKHLFTSEETLHWEPMSRTKRDHASLLEGARESLQLLEGKDLTESLMRSSDACDAQSPKRFTLTRKTGLRSLNFGDTTKTPTRGLRPGERIDFFLSHSWSDNAPAKWKVLESVKAKFLEQNGRLPTFWLDKVCIDQSNIDDGKVAFTVAVARITTPARTPHGNSIRSDHTESPVLSHTPRAV